MRTMLQTVLVMGSILAAGLARSASAAGTNDAAQGGLKLVPLPKSVNARPGRMYLGTRIVVENPGLNPLAAVLSQEIETLTGRKLTMANGPAHAGDIVLRMDPGLTREAYTVQVSFSAIVTGGNPAAVALGTVSLLQALTQFDGRPGYPLITIKDEPFASVRGLMIDAARQWHSLESLKQMVELCRWYKINQLQIHFTDDQSFTLPSTAFPTLATTNRHYTVEQLRDLEAFAKVRGVEILPELEMPGHASAMVNQMPETFANEPKGANVICPGREETYRALDILIGEITDIFRTTSYFHIGADEVNMEPWKNCKHCQAFMASHKLDNVDELYRYFIVRMNEIVRKHGKSTIVWEGFHKDGKTEIPRNVTVMVFESLYNIAPDVLAQGYPVINTSWKPLYIVNQRNWSPEYIYNWNMYRWENWWDASRAFKKPIEVAPDKLVLGAEMCTWEQGKSIELPSVRRRLAAMSERLWSPDAKRTYEDFAARMEATDASLSRVLPEVPPKNPNGQPAGK